jgi:Permuted papain-like amidase enzyme, YaeF/YiiX, C92 family
MSHEPVVGDYFVVHTTGWAARLIQLGTWSKWNHAGIYIGDEKVIEARPNGVKIRSVHEYDGLPIMWSNESSLTETERLNLVNFAKHFENDGYGIWSIIALAFKCLGINVFPAIKRAENENRVICSQLVAWCYSHVGIKLSVKQHALVTPADLAKRLSRK